MKKLFLTFAVVMMTLSSNANEIGSNDDCFSLSLDGKTISHIVLYTYDYENQRPDFTIPIINVRVFDFLDNTITGSILGESVTNSLKPNPYNQLKPYPATHHVVFSQIKLNGQKVSYDVKVDGVAQEIGSGMTIVRGQSEVLVDGKKVTFPNLKTLRYCPNPSDQEEIRYVESIL